MIVNSLSGLGQASGVYEFMHSAWGWPLIESLHFTGLCLLIGTVGVFDLRVLGMASGVSYRDLHSLVPIGVFGYLLNVITGTMFIVSAPDQYLFNPAFLSKVGFMAIAGLNMLAFYRISAVQVRHLPPTTKASTSARTFAALSLACWCAVIVCGRLITYFRPPYHWCIWC